MKALLALEDGRTFACRSFTGHGESTGEVVFNTGMAGYQEVLTDPSYTGQMVTMTYPLIGNYGVNFEDVESDRVQVAAFIVREYQAQPSNWRSVSTLADYLKAQGVLGVEDLDTRALTRHIRSQGAMRAALSTKNLNPESLVEVARGIAPMAGLDLAKEVSAKSAFLFNNGALDSVENLDPAVWKQVGKKRVVAFDFGIKYNIARNLEGAGCEVLVVPAETDAKTVEGLEPDGVFLSNGPGDPEPVEYAIQTIAQLKGKYPMFGICLGHQILALALGGKTYKLKFGHRGVNQPVKNLLTSRVEITSQNHGFAVDAKSLPADDLELTHINMNDNTCEGFRHKSLPLFAVQYHPEAAPGPHDAHYLFQQFMQMMEN